MSASLMQRAVRAVGVRGVLDAVPEAAREALRFDWRSWARPEQIEPSGNWLIWFVKAGRGFGKTRLGAEWVRERVESGIAQHVILAAPTAEDLRTVMVEGESGIMAISPPWFRPTYEPSKSQITWPNGAKALLISADEPERFRGKQGDTVWCDEICSWRYPEAFDLLRFGMRLGNPRYCLTSSPKPTKLVRELMADARVVVTAGSTFENEANLAPEYIADLRDKYDGTRLGRQELYAEVLDDVPGALWQHAQLEALRVRAAPPLHRTVVAIDPATTSGEKSDETGIIVVGLDEAGQAYVLADLTCKLSPDGWARRAVDAYERYGADRIVAERNQGGDMVEHTIRTVSPRVSYRSVVAKRGKFVRAEPVAALYEQGKVHHVGGLSQLEDQMTHYTPDDFDGSPDRVDALVWALTDLMIGEPSAATPYSLPRPKSRW